MIIVKRIVFALVALIIVSGVWAIWIEPASLRVRSYEIGLGTQSQAASLKDLKIAVIADLHVGSPLNGMDRLAEVVRRTNAESPDIILLTGDYLISDVLGGTFHGPAVIGPVLGQLEAPLGVWSVLGNHDIWKDERGMTAALEANGIVVLDNNVRSVTWGGTDVLLVGAADFRERGASQFVNTAIRSHDGPVMLFTHNPDLFPELPPGVTLAIGAHTHGGQVSLPFIGAPIVPSRYGQRYVEGHVVENGRHHFISPGIGTSILPIRFGVPPEISILILGQ